MSIALICPEVLLCTEAWGKSVRGVEGRVCHMQKSQRRTNIMTSLGFVIQQQTLFNSLCNIIANVK